MEKGLQQQVGYVVPRLGKRLFLCSHCGTFASLSGYRFLAYLNQNFQMLPVKRENIAISTFRKEPDMLKPMPQPICVSSVHSATCTSVDSLSYYFCNQIFFRFKLFRVINRIVSLLARSAYLEASAEAALKQAESANKTAKTLMEAVSFGLS